MTPIASRDRFIVFVVMASGLLATALATWSYGPAVGGGAAFVSALLIWRALDTGFVLDDGGLTVRSFVPGAGRRVPWSELLSVDVDEIVLRTSEGSSTQVRIRFFVERGEHVQLAPCPRSIAERVLECFETRGLPASDSRP